MIPRTKVNYSLHELLRACFITEGSCKTFKVPPPDSEQEWACIRFPLRIQGDKFAFYNRAVERGIDFAFSFAFIACPEEFRNALRLARSVLDLPFYEKLSERELKRGSINAERNGRGGRQ